MSFLPTTALRTLPTYRLSRSGLPALLIPLMLLPVLLSLQPVTAVSASTAGSDPRLSRAALWAQQQTSGTRRWIANGETLCGTFVENAYGVSGIYESAYGMYRALGRSGDASHHTLAGLQRAPIGAIVFFAPNARNSYSGHVGIYVGSGQFVGIGSGGHARQYSVQWWSSALSPFVGWAYPPSNWPGRKVTGAS
jgi:cell wall-associated NlpC family hydrolase